MDFQIARHALHRFLDQQIALIESTPLPPEVRKLVPRADLADSDLGCVWLAAGLASQIGLVLLDEPQRFIEPSPAAKRGSDPDPLRGATGSDPDTLRSAMVRKG